MVPSPKVETNLTRVHVYLMHEFFFGFVLCPSIFSDWYFIRLYTCMVILTIIIEFGIFTFLR